MTAVAVYTMTDSSIFEGDAAGPDAVSLMARCQAGEAAALRILYHTHRMAVYRLTARMVANETDREDVVQEAFFQIFRSIRHFKGQAQPATWIHRITYNVVLQYIRKKKSRVHLHLVTPTAIPSLEAGTDVASPETKLHAKEKKDAVYRALEALSPKKRAVLVLHDFEGINAKEIAYIVRTSVLTVRTRLFYARKEFYDRLAEEPAFSDIDFCGD